jgi:hypothetical protein
MITIVARYIVLAALLLIAACAAPIYTNFDYDRDADFSRYRTFQWYDPPQEDPQNIRQAQQRSPLEDKRIKSVVNGHLTKKGLGLVDKNADLFVAYYTSAEAGTDISSSGYGYGFSGTTTVRNYEQGTFILDLIDAGTQQLVWRGTAEGAFDEKKMSPEYIDSKIKEAIEKLMKNYPPS